MPARVIVQRPSVTGIVAWATARFSEHRLGLLVLALAAAIIAVARVALANVFAPSRPPFDALLTLAQALVLLLCTAAMVLLVIRPPGARVTDAVGEALNAPRLVIVKIATAVLPWLLSLALAGAANGMRNGTVAIVIWLLSVPLAFVCQLAFVSAVIEETGPRDAIADAFRRARLSGVPIVVGLSILLALLESGPNAIPTLVAHEIFPPPDVPVYFPAFPGVTLPLPSLPVMMRPASSGARYRGARAPLSRS